MPDDSDIGIDYQCDVCNDALRVYYQATAGPWAAYLYGVQAARNLYDATKRAAPPNDLGDRMVALAEERMNHAVTSKYHEYHDAIAGHQAERDHMLATHPHNTATPLSDRENT